VSSFRACDARRKGLDRTLFGHIAVVFVDEVQPFLTGCVALDNQLLSDKACLEEAITAKEYG
ncbi:hypothetical protein ANCDUO_24767, partial [Ancylostoma duodenale]